MASKIGASPKSLPKFGESNDFGSPYVDYDGLYRLIARERGVERDHRVTGDENELMYWIFAGVTADMAQRYELIHRMPNKDSRRLWFKQQLALLAKLDEKWKERQEREQKEILARYPYFDRERSAPERD